MSKLLPLVMIGSILIVFAGVLLFSSSKKTPSSDNMSLALTNISPVPTNKTMDRFKELQFDDEKVGTGAAVKSGDTVTVHYSGMLTNGLKFDSSYDRGQPFSTKIGIGMVIKGWDEGIIGMQVGGKRKLMIPSSMGYGEYGAPPSIPGDSDLIFEVELLGIK